jgi:hypothetical protein
LGKGLEPAGDLEAGHPGQTYIQDNDVRPDLAVQSQGSFTIPGLPHDLYFGIVCQQLPHPDADEFVIVDDQDPDHDAPSFREPHPRLARIRSS